MSIAGKIAKNSLFNFITTALNTSAMLIVCVVLARYFGTEKYGTYSFMMWFLSLAVLVTNLGVGNMTQRFIAEAMGQQNARVRKGIIQLSLVMRGISTLLASLLIIIFSGQLARSFNMPPAQTYFILVGVGLFPYMLTFTLANVFAGFQKYEYTSYVEMLISPFRVVLVIILIAFGFGLREILVMYAAVWVAGLLFSFFLTNRLEPLRDLFLPSLLNRSVRNEAIKYSLAAMGILGVDYFLWQNAEVMFLGIYRPVVEVGFYNIAYRIPSLLIVVIPFVLGQVLLPSVSEQFGKGDMEKIKKIYVTAARYLMVLSFPLATVGIALAAPIINVLFGSEYAPAIVLMQIIFVPFALRGLIFAVSSIIYGIKEPGYLLKAGAVLVFMSIGLNLWLIPGHGAMGAAIATSIPRVIALPIYIFFVSRKIKTSWPMVDTVKIALVSVGVGLVAFVIQHYLENDILSICLSVPISFIAFVIALLVLGVVKADDLTILKRAEQRLPLPFRRGFAAIIRMTEKFVR